MTQTDPAMAPLGIIESLSAGFRATAQKPALVFIPLVLDLFLWLGPRLSVTPIVAHLGTQFAPLLEQTSANSAALFERNATEVLGSYNFFSALSTWPLGVPSLLAGSVLGTSPVGTPLTLHVHTSEELLAWLVALILGGLLLGTLYLGLIASWTGGDYISLSDSITHSWQHWVRIIALVSAVAVGAFLYSVPLFLAVELVAIASAPLGSLLLLAGIGMGMWVLFHLFFAAHSILLEGAPVRQAMRNSVDLVRRDRFSCVGLLLIAVVISLGLSTVWNLPPSESWMRFIAIAGNAFVNTGLAAATFVFYRERATL